MGEKWSKLVADSAFGSYGTGVSPKILYGQIEDANRFNLVTDAIDENPALNELLGSNGISWPKREENTDKFFNELSEEQSEIVK